MASQKVRNVAQSEGKGTKAAGGKVGEREKGKRRKGAEARRLSPAPFHLFSLSPCRLSHLRSFAFHAPTCGPALTRAKVAACKFSVTKRCRDLTFGPD